MFNISFPNLVKHQLPIDRRTQFNVILQLWWLSLVDKLHQAAHVLGLMHYEWATTTAQTGSLVQILNAHFDNDLSRIYITDVDWFDDVYIFLDQEPYDDVILYLDSETLPDPLSEVYLFTDAEVNPYQFIIWIPASLDLPEFHEQITALAEQHCLAGKTFIIEIIP